MFGPFYNPNINMQMPIDMNNNNYNMMQFYLAQMMGSNMNIPGMNIGGNEKWANAYKTNTNQANINNQVNNNQVLGNMKSCVFKTTQGVIRNIQIDNDKTISELIRTYFYRVGKPELFDKKNDICFLFNASKLDFNSQTKVGDFFGLNSFPTILVNDVKNLIGA